MMDKPGTGAHGGRGGVAVFADGVAIGRRVSPAHPMVTGDTTGSQCGSWLYGGDVWHPSFQMYGGHLAYRVRWAGP